jgi:hypothetical protein
LDGRVIDTGVNFAPGASAKPNPGDKWWEKVEAALH